MSEVPELDGREALHRWWSLSYASYWTCPRSIFQSMSDEWQAKMVALLEEADDAVIKHGIEWPRDGFGIDVRLVPLDYDGHNDVEPPLYPDDLADYQRGRRRLWVDEG